MVSVESMLNAVFLSFFFPLVQTASFVLNMGRTPTNVVDQGEKLEITLLCPLVFMAHGCETLLESSHSAPCSFQKQQKLVGSRQGGSPSLISDDKL